jgi:hypothetical protein
MIIRFAIRRFVVIVMSLHCKLHRCRVGTNSSGGAAFGSHAARGDCKRVHCGAAADVLWAA